MNLKFKTFRMPATATSDKLSYSGGGKISVSVNSIVRSEKVQRQVSAVKAMAASQGTKIK